MRKTILLFCICVLKSASLNAHIGSPDVVMQGSAGPYSVLVNIKPPDVIPGVAKVTVYLQDAVTSITLRAVYFRTGNEGAPAADEMKKVNGLPGRYYGEQWLMNGGSSSVQLKLKGPKGNGEIIVPVVAVSTADRDLPAATGYLLAALGILLLVLFVRMTGASVSDALTKPAEPVSNKGKKAARVGMIIAALFALLLLYGGHSWWQAWADDYKQYKYQSTKANCTVTNTNGTNELRFTLDTSDDAQRKTLYSFIVPDHGKLMHMFLVRIPAMDAFAHLHPRRMNAATFSAVLLGLPEGKYLVFADIVYVSGFTETMKDTMEIKNSITNNMHQSDPDDAVAFALPADASGSLKITDHTFICGKPGTGAMLTDGSRMIWEGMTNEPMIAGRLYNFKFSVSAPDNRPAALDNYLGMKGHAAIIRNDGNVYMHLHPMGTVSMAAEANFIKRLSSKKGDYIYPFPQQFQDSVDGYLKTFSVLSYSAKDSILARQMNMPSMKQSDMYAMMNNNTLEFPYSFPSPGKYRIWIQIKRNGQVLTGAFDKMVK